MDNSVRMSRILDAFIKNRFYILMQNL